MSKRKNNEETSRYLDLIKNENTTYKCEMLPKQYLKDNS